MHLFVLPFIAEIIPILNDDTGIFSVVDIPDSRRYEMYAPGVSAAKANADGYQINWSAAGYTC